MKYDFQDLTHRLNTVTAHADEQPGWPTALIDRLTEAGAWRWIIPCEFGGLDWEHSRRLAGYEAVARGCLSAALILTQRDGACGLLLRGENTELRDRLLPQYATGARFTSIGISQITTSKGATGPKMVAMPDGDGYRLEGVMPWVSGACACDDIITAAVLPDGRQLVAVVDCHRPEVVIDPPMRLLALEASCTSRVHCRGAYVGPGEIVRQPHENALSKRGPVKSLVVSTVGIGVARGLWDHLERRLENSPAEIREVIDPLAECIPELRERLYRAADEASPQSDPDSAVALRIEINDLITKLAIAFLTASKGTGYARPHPAERLLREAMFFLVWSAPTAVQAGTLRLLLGSGG